MPAEAAAGPTLSGRCSPRYAVLFAGLAVAHRVCEVAPARPIGKRTLLLQVQQRRQRCYSNRQTSTILSSVAGVLRAHTFFPKKLGHPGRGGGMNHPLWRWIIGVASAAWADRVPTSASGSSRWLSRPGLLTLFALIMAALPDGVAQTRVLQLPAQAETRLRAASTMPRAPAKPTPEVTVNPSHGEGRRHREPAGL